MIKKVVVSMLTATMFFMHGCGSTGSGATGPSSGDGSIIGSLSGSEDIAAYLEEGTWSSIDIDLDKFLYDNANRASTYKLEMTFSDGAVNVLADCNIITASYRIKNDDEISFYSISSPKPAIDYPSCKEFADADNAAASFLSSSYIVDADSQTEVGFTSLEIDAQVTLNR